MAVTPLEHALHSRLQLRHVRQLTAVERFGAVSRAAEVLHISQPALSKSIREVEDSLGVSLFERTARGLVPTIAGKLLLQHCHFVESSLRQAAHDLEAHLAGTGGQVTVGAYVVAMPRLIPLAISRLMKDGYGVTVRIRDGSGGQLLSSLYAGDVDFIVGCLPDVPVTEPLLHELLYEQPICVVANPTHPLAQRQFVTYQDLCDYPWIEPAPDIAAYTPVTDLFLREGLPKPRMCIEGTSLLMIRTLLEEQPVLAVMPYQVIERDVELGVLKVLPIKLPFAPLPVGITRHASRPAGPAAVRFMECLRAVATRFQGQPHPE